MLRTLCRLQFSKLATFSKLDKDESNVKYGRAWKYE
jgi:hypothetical protein